MVLGNFLFLAMAGYFVSVLPLLAAKAPQVINAGFESGFGIFPLGGTALLFIGSILLGIAVMRAKVFPAVVGLLFLISAVLNLATIIFQSGLLATLIGLLSTVSVAIAVGWVGTILMHQPKVREAEASSASQAVLR
jgi:hypothetical protein